MDIVKLKQIAEEYALKQWEGQLPWSVIQKAYYDGYRDCQKKLEKENAELKEQIEALANVNIKAQNIIGEAKEIIRNLLRATYGEGWNYSLGLKVEAEKFLEGE